MTILDEVNSTWNESNATLKLQEWFRNLEEQKAAIKSSRGLFHQWDPLVLYVSSSKPIGHFDLRYHGQNVAELVINNREVNLTLTEKQINTNIRYYGELTERFKTLKDYKLCGFQEKVEIKRKKKIKNYFCLWSGETGRQFRREFTELEKKNAGIHNRSPEHAIESKFLKRMPRNYAPVKIEGIPLQIPVPCSANTGEVKKSRGNIDILARHRIRGTNVILSVWELKKPGERSYKAALRQVYIYTVQILKILRSSTPEMDWYKMFGFSSKLPKKLVIEAVVCLSGDQINKNEKERNDYSANMPLIIENDKIQVLRACYNSKTYEIDTIEDISWNNK